MNMINQTQMTELPQTDSDMLYAYIRVCAVAGIAMLMTQMLCVLPPYQDYMINLQTKIKSQKSELEMEKQKRQEDETKHVQEYNKLVVEYNELLEENNTLNEKEEANIADYNKLVGEYNELLEENNELELNLGEMKLTLNDDKKIHKTLKYEKDELVKRVKRLESRLTRVTNYKE
jgi:chromosome segregation ATPase